MWLHHPDFAKILNTTWLTNPIGNVAESFLSKVNAFQALAKNWNNSVFGNIFQRMKNLHAEIQYVQGQIKNTHLEALLAKEHQLLLQLEDLFKEEELFWAQRAKTKWLQLGDKNNKFFQMQTTIKTKRNQILHIKDNIDNWTNDQDHIASVLISAFKKCFTTSVNPTKEALAYFISFIDPCIS